MSGPVEGWVKPAPAYWSSRTPGRRFFGLLIPVVGVALYGSSVPAWDWVWVVIAFAVLIPMGLAWLVLFLDSARGTHLKMSRRTWARWLGGPIIFILCFGLMRSGVVAAVRFELSRPALERAASQMSTGERDNVGWIGLLPIDTMGHRADGTTDFIITEDGNPFSSCTLAYNPLPSANVVEMRGRKMADHWWYWCGPVTAEGTSP